MIRSRKTIPAIGLSLLGLLLPGLLLSGCARGPRRPTLDLWIGDWNADTRKLLDTQVIPEFERKHNVDVKVQYLDWSHLDEKLTVTFAGGVQPDVFQIGAEYVGGMAYRGQAEVLDDYVKDWPQRKDFIPASWATVMANGHSYGVPYLSAPRLLIYRKDLVRKAGLPDPPRNWDEWRKAGLSLVERNERGKITRAGIDVTGNWQLFVALLWANGGDILTPDGQHAAFNSPAGVQALQYLADLFRKDRICPPEGIPSTMPGVPIFASGQSAMEINNQFSIRNVVKYSHDFGIKDVGVAIPPTPKVPVVAVYTDWLAISAQSKKKALAWELVKHLTRPDNLIKYNETQYFIPPIRSAANSDYVKNTPFMPFFMRAMEEHGRSLPPIPEWFEMRAGLRRVVDQAVFGAKEPKQALDEYAADVDKLIAQRAKTQ